MIDSWDWLTIGQAHFKEGPRYCSSIPQNTTVQDLMM